MEKTIREGAWDIIKNHFRTICARANGEWKGSFMIKQPYDKQSRIQALLKI